jgi:N-sulfoglucosamine sulfohydrolase
MSLFRPNILYIHSHDTGRYVQPYGHAIPTPNLQRLAEQGILFRKAFSAAPTCSPSRAALLTGQAPHSSGMLGLAHLGFALHDHRQHLLHTLREIGYHSVLVGMQHLVPDADVGKLGYDQVLPVPDSLAASVAPAAAQFLRNAPAQPFFLDVGLFETHRVFFQPGVHEDPRYCLPPPPIPDTPQTRQDMAAYKASARSMDHGIGIVLDALEAAGLADQTLVISTTDHGLAFPHMKCNLTDSGIGVMLIMRGPGGFAGGKVHDALISHIDVFPTICDLLEIAPPSWLQGKSMLPVIRGEAVEINDAIFGEVTYHVAYEPQRAVRTQRWKYIRRYEQRTQPILSNCDGSPSKALWVQSGWQARSVEQEQLYDLIFDPNEANNLVREPAFADVLHALRQRLEHWMQATRDPLLDGPVAPPPGALVGDPDEIEPSI